MDSSPPSNRSEPRLRTKSTSRLARSGGDFSSEGQERELFPSSPSRTPNNLSPDPSNPLPIRELLLLSKRSQTRLEMNEELVAEPPPAAAAALRRRCKNRTSSQLVCGSPRNAPKPRRRVEAEIREEMEVGMAEEIGRARKRRNSRRERREKLLSSVAPSPPPPSSSPQLGGVDDAADIERIWEMLKELLMWKDVAKSSLWFGLGSLCFFSSCFSKGISFSLISAISQMGLLLLCLSFLSSTYFQRGHIEQRCDYKLKEEDILKAARLVLPAANLAISMTRGLFSGDPSMTLKVAPFFVAGAEYGHLITLRGLCAIGFFVSFTVPILYSSYFAQIDRQVEFLKWWALNAWGACSYKKFTASSLVVVFWNLSTVKARIFAVFIGLVILRYQYGQRSEVGMVEEEEGEVAGLQRSSKPDLVVEV